MMYCILNLFPSPEQNKMNKRRIDVLIYNSESSGLSKKNHPPSPSHESSFFFYHHHHHHRSSLLSFIFLILNFFFHQKNLKKLWGKVEVVSSALMCKAAEAGVTSFVPLDPFRYSPFLRLTQSHLVNQSIHSCKWSSIFSDRNGREINFLYHPNEHFTRNKNTGKRLWWRTKPRRVVSNSIYLKKRKRTFNLNLL